MATASVNTAAQANPGFRNNPRVTARKSEPRPARMEEKGEGTVAPHSLGGNESKVRM